MAMNMSQTCRITRVVKGPTRVPGLHQYVIDTDALGLQVQTVDAWKATLCDRARQLGRWVRLTWKRTPYGKTLSAVKFTEAP